MKALTVRQPWAWAIAHGTKRTENRPRRMSYRGSLWLHAGARSRWDPAAESSPLVLGDWAQYRHDHVPGWPGLPDSDVTLGRKTTLMPFGAVVAQVTVTGCHWWEDCKAGDERPAAMCSPWAVRGQFHIELANAVRLLAAPVPCKGALSLWTVPAAAETAVRAQMEDK